MLHVYKSTTSEESGAGLIVLSLEGRTYEHTLKFMFKMSNNEVEYEVLMVSIEICNVLGEECLKAFPNSQVVGE